MNSFEYKDFNDKLQRPVIEACDIIIKQSLPEQFLGAFREQINENDIYETKVEVSTLITHKCINENGITSSFAFTASLV